jgi:hypothetical protein
VLDQETKDILATVLRVQDLREIGVTLHVYAFPSFFLSSSPVTIFPLHTKKATSLISTASVRRPRHLLRRSNPGQHQENRTRPPKGSLRVFPPQLFGTASAVIAGRARRGSREGWDERARRAGQTRSELFSGSAN